MASILAEGWAFARPPANSGDSDRSRDSNAGARRVSAPPVGRLLGRSPGAGGGLLLCAAIDEPIDGGDAAVEARGAGVDSGRVDAAQDGASGVEVTCSGVAFDKPGLVELLPAVDAAPLRGTPPMQHPEVPPSA
jgi:hypothetical protein